LAKWVIVESPTKARTIQSILGDQYNVVASFGHILDLPAFEFGIDLKNHFHPTWTFLPKKETWIESISRKLKNGDLVILATDPDREGETISFQIKEIISKKKKVNFQRVRFNEITKESIQYQINHPGSIDVLLVESQFSRRILDRLFGYQVSPFLWKQFSNHHLSAGRVQSVALGWICEREKEIEDFIPEEYFDLNLFEKDSVFKWDLEEPKKPKTPLSFLNQKENMSIQDMKKSKIMLKNEGIKIKNVDTFEKKISPPPPYKTSSLQTDAFKVLKFSPSKTMKLAQDLFDGSAILTGNRNGLITYMRTDSSFVSEDKFSKGCKYIKNNYGVDFLSKRKKNQSQGAHEAIIPTNPEKNPNMLNGILKKDHHALYQLIWNRFIASLMKESIETHQKAFGEWRNTIWVQNQIEIKDSGWKIVYPNWNKDEKIRKLNQNTSLSLSHLESEKKSTQPPDRYTEGELIQKLEKSGVGRPSTYVNTIETLYKRNYSLLEKKRIIPTAMGRKVHSTLFQTLGSLIHEKFTSEMETMLDKIESGDLSREVMLSQFQNSLSHHLSGAKKIIGLEKNLSKDVCPQCKEGTVKTKISKNKKDILYICSRYPYCDFVSSEKPEISK
jgi:DNA topoisomerase-1